MKIDKKESQLLQFIKYLPPILIIISSIFAIYFFSYYYKKDLEKDKIEIQNQYIEYEKNRIKDNVNSVYYYIEDEKVNAEKAIKKKLKNYVYGAYEGVTSLYNDYKDLELKKKIVIRIKNILRNIRFNNNKGHYFIYAKNGDTIFNALNPEYEGLNIYKDIASNKIQNENILDTVKNKKEGFVTWYYTKPGDNSKKEYKKIGFIKEFKPYNWFIGMGEYEVDINRKLKEKILKYIKLLKYENNEYMFALDLNGKILAHKDERLENRSLFNVKELEVDKKRIKAFLNSNEKSIYIEHKLFGNERIGYLKKVYGCNNKCEYVIGTSFNLQRLNNLIRQRQERVLKNSDENLHFIIISTLLIIPILLFISFFISRKIEKTFLSYRQQLKNSEKKKYEETLDELRAILDNLPMMIGYKDINNNVITVNKHSANFMNKSVEELSNIPMQYIFPDRYEMYHEYDKEVIANKQVKTGIIETHLLNGKERLIDISIVPVINNGKVENLIIFMVDITEKKLLQDENEHKEKLLYQQSKMASMGEMIGNIAHQWRQPLSTISTASTGVKLQDEMGILKKEDIELSMNAINDAAQYLSQTIDDFRNFFHPKNNSFKKFNIYNTVEKTLKLISSGLERKGIKIIKTIDEIEINSLENEIIQVLMNILNNAKDALVSVNPSEKLIFINIYKKDDSLFIEIKDNANGIKEDIINRVFEPYFTTKHKAQGTGIGLYMSHEIINRLLKGTLEVENSTYFYNEKEYTGARFIIELKI